MRELLAVSVGPVSGSEGFPVTGQIATFLSSDVQGSSPTAVISWGDGHTTAGTVVMDGTNFAVDGTNTYAVNGTYPVNVTVSGTDGSTASGQGQATINPVMLLATGTTITPVAGQPFTGVVASFTDPYPGLSASSYAATVAWGDGHTTIGSIAPNGSGGFNVTGTNTYATAGTQSVAVTITRLIDNQSATATTNAVVVAPAITATGTTITPIAGQPFTGVIASFTDSMTGLPASDYSATVAWGDGHTSVGTIASNGTGGFNVTGTNTYAATGTDSVTVTITRLSNNQSATATTTAVVVAPAITATGTTITPIAGQQFTGLVASFTDNLTGLPASDYSATVAWGDGHTSAGTIASNGTGGFNVTGTNTYASTGTDSVTVTVTRLTNNQSTTATTTAVVVASAITATGTTITPIAGQPFTGLVATFTDSLTGLPASDYSATIVWGDGHTSIGTIAPNATGGFNVTGTNTYAATGTDSVTVTVTRLTNNQSATATTTAVVVAPTITATGSTITPIAGQLFTGLVATFTDSMTGLPASDYSATIAWGDGHTSIGIIAPNATGGFNVTGTNTYAATGTDSVTVTITRLTNNQSATATTTAVVVAPAITATGTTITPVAGQPFTGVVATFTDTYPGLTASGYTAVVAWGDGHTSVGTVEPNGTGGYNILGTNTYAATGTQSITVTITRLIDNQSATATSTAVVVAPSIAATGTTIVATAGQTFTGTVAIFSDATPGTVPGDYHASISWGNGQSSVGTIVANATGGFSVVGTTFFGAASSGEMILVTIVRNSDGATATASSTGIVVSATATLGGELDPLSDTGVSDTDGVTAINYPSFFGTATPYAVIQFYSRGVNQAQPVLLGQAVANYLGAWNFAVGALPDGAYTFSVAQIPTNGPPSPMVLLTPGNVIIDTVPPTVVATSGSSNTNQIAITFKDNLSGLDLATIANPLNYALVGPHRARIHPTSVIIVPNATVVPSDPVTVTLQFNHLPKNHAHAKVALGQITDLAGNGLKREYVNVRITSTGHSAIPTLHLTARSRHKTRHV